MSRSIKLAAIAVLSAIAAFSCSGSSGGAAQITIGVEPGSIDNLGMPSTITVQATTETGSPGSGSVKITTAAGSLKGDGQTVTLNTKGQGVADFTCAASADQNCRGLVRINADWMRQGGSVTNFRSIQVTGYVDAGSDAGPDAGTPDAGVDGGAGDGGMSSVTLSATRSKIYLGVGDLTVVTATLLGPVGTPLPNEQLTFSTSLGAIAFDGGTSVTTTANGTASATFTETGASGIATITATHAPSGRSGTTQVEILGVQQIQHVSTLCGAIGCTVMGIKSSGFNEVATVKFKVTDTQSKPVAGITVMFTIGNPPTGTTTSPSGVTNLLGEATASVSAGLKIGSFSLHATVVPGSIEADSTTISIRGAKPTNKGFTFFCSPVNIDAYHSPTPPLSFKPVCTIKLIDRYLNPVGTGTSVNFKTEAGSIPNLVATQPFVPNTANTNEGYGTVTFDTQGVWPATDVVPFAPVPSQFPYPRSGEPSRTDGLLTRNPRDGLVSIIAYTQGEEFFEDTNSNGIRDANEPFIDQGEPFVDANDNGIADLGELNSVLDTNGNMVWDGPNGMWDGNTTIWSETRILYTNFAEPGLGKVIPTPWGPIPKGGSQSVAVFMPDLNLNRPQAASTSFSASHTATKGTVSLLPGTFQDGYGFDLERQLVDAVNEGECKPGITPICKHKYLFGDWGAGFLGEAVLLGAAITDMTPAAADALTITITTNGTTTKHTAAGVMQ